MRLQNKWGLIRDEGNKRYYRMPVLPLGPRTLETRLNPATGKHQPYRVHYRQSDAGAGCAG